MDTVLRVTVIVLGTTRLMQLILVDRIFAWFRALVDKAVGTKPGAPLTYSMRYPSYLIRCQWCLSMWVALLVGIPSVLGHLVGMAYIMAIPALSLAIVLVDKAIDRFLPDTVHNTTPAPTRADALAAENLINAARLAAVDRSAAERALYDLSIASAPEVGGLNAPDDTQ